MAILKLTDIVTKQNNDSDTVIQDQRHSDIPVFTIRQSLNDE